MKSGAYWLLWILLIIVVVYSFPKPCGYREVQNAENDIGVGTYESNTEENLYNEAISDFDITGEVVSESVTTEYNCLGFEDNLISKLRKNSTVQLCYGVCLQNSIKNEEITENNSIVNYTDSQIPSFLVETMKGLSKALFIFIIVVLLIIVFMVLKPIFKRN